MTFHLKKLFFTVTFNLSLFLLLMIGIQNSTNKQKVSFFIRETIKLPISFIIGISFISGSITGSIFTLNIREENNKIS